MDIPSGYLNKFKPEPHAPRSEREELLSKFMERLNQGRLRKGFKPMTPSRLAKLFEGYSVQGMYRVFRDCEQAKSFGALFWWHIKNNNETKTDSSHG